MKRLPRQFCWENDSTQKFKDVLRSSSTQILIREFLNENEATTNVDISLEKVEHILIATAKRCLKIKSVKRHKRVQSSSNKKWFDKECRFKRHELRKLANQKHRDPLRVIFSEYRESEDTHEKSIFLLFHQNIPLGELIQGKIV